MKVDNMLMGNPMDMAKEMARNYMLNAQVLLESQMKRTKTEADALMSLRSALQAFQAALHSFTGQSGMLRHSAQISDPSVGKVSVTGAAQKGTYSFFVERLASAHQVAFKGMKSVSAESAGSLRVKLDGGTCFEVDLSAADRDGDGKVSPAELARAINQAPDNKGKVSASLVTVNGQARLVLSSTETGAASKITVDTSKVSDAELKKAFENPDELAAAQDAIIWLGDQKSGMKVEQSSNTFTGIDGMSVTFTQAMKSGQAPVVVTVATDHDATADTLQKFVDAYNKLKKTVVQLAASGNPDAGIPAGPLSGDLGMRVLQQRINEMLRESFDGARLFDYGVEADRNGNLSLNKSKLKDALEKRPDGLSKVFGDANAGLAGHLSQYLKSWLSSTDGRIKKRQDSVQQVQSTLDKKQISLNQQYSQAFERYLKQFTQMQLVQQQMSRALDMFDNLKMDK